MKNRVVKIKEEIEKSPHSPADELVIIGLRQIELLEQIAAQTAPKPKKIKETNTTEGVKDERKPRKRRRKSKPGKLGTKRIGVGSLGGHGDDERRQLARQSARRVEERQVIDEIQGCPVASEIIPGSAENDEQGIECERSDNPR